MTAPVQISEISDFMNQHLVEVFQTMLSMKAVSAGRIERLPQTDRVSGSVGFGGETVSGAMYLHFAPPLAASAAGAMLGMPPGELPGDAEINDVVGEVTNMLGGGFKSWLCDAGAPCAMSTPAIIRGTAFSIETAPGIERICLAFDCASERVVFEIHLKFN